MLIQIVFHWSDTAARILILWEKMAQSLAHAVSGCQPGLLVSNYSTTLDKLTRVVHSHSTPFPPKTIESDITGQ